MKYNLLIKILIFLIILVGGYLIYTTFFGEVDEEDLVLSTQSITIKVGEKAEVTAEVLPEKATYKNVSWTSSDPEIAIVQDGTVTGISPGNCIVTATTEKTFITRDVYVTIEPIIIPVTSITVQEPNIELYINDTKKISYTIEPSDATDKKVKFQSSDENIATINSDKNVVGVSEGTATITLIGANDVKAYVNVTVKKRIIDVASVTIDKSSLSMYVGDESLLKATIKPNDATDKSLVWSSSNSNIAKVNNGKVTALTVGDTVITAKSKNGVSATCKVSVKVKQAAPIVPSSASYKYEGATLKYYIVNKGQYHLTYIWMSDPYNQIKKLEANVAANGKVLSDAELSGYQLKRNSVGQMMNGYIAHGIIPVSKAAIGFNASGFYVQGAWNPPASYYNNHSNSWFSMMDGKILRNYQDDGLTESGMIGISPNGDLKIYPIVKSKAERVNVYNQIMSDKIRNTWSFYPPLIKNGAFFDSGIVNSAKRQGICQVNSNNYVMLTTQSNFNYRNMADVFLGLGCKQAHNLDGGGSTSLFYKKPGSSQANQVICSDGRSHNVCRFIVEGIYFVEK